MIQRLKTLFNRNAFQDVKVVRDSLGDLQRKILFVVVFTLSIFTSFYAGEYWTSEIAHERDRLLKENAALKMRLDQEKVNFSAAELKVEIANMAVEKVRSTNSELLLQISDLERDVAYYQRVMTPIRNDKGLRIDTLEIESTTDANRFRVNFVLTQQGKKNSTIIQGVFDFSLEGSELGVKKTYQLEDLKLADNDVVSKFRFRYYQELSEEFVLPDNFVVEKMHLRATSSGSKSMTIEKTENWPIK